MAQISKRQVVLDAIKFKTPAYVPWNWAPTIDCSVRLREYLGSGVDLDAWMDNHYAWVEANLGAWQPASEGRVRDPYGVVWDRTVDKDIGSPCDWPIKEPGDLARYKWPNVSDPSVYAHLPAAMRESPDCFRIYAIGFSLYERAWTLRGVEDLLMDMIERPDFVEDLLDTICEQNLIQVNHAISAGVDAVFFGDDYGMQTGLIMGIDNWRRFIKPRLARMFAPVVRAGKVCGMHSCGQVSELFDDLVEIGLNVFNPFQPEVMDVFSLMKRYRGRLAFHGGMSVQKVLPFGTVQEVRDLARRLLDAGRDGGYIFAPSHSVPHDVPPENLVAMMEVLKSQPGYSR